MYFDIRLAVAADLAAATDLLRAVNQPAADVDAGQLVLVAQDTVATLGVIGMQSFGTVALPRCLVVSPCAGRGA